MKIRFLLAIFTLTLFSSPSYAFKVSYTEYDKRIDNLVFMLNLRDKELEEGSLTDDQIIEKQCHRYRIYERILILSAENLQFDESLSLASQSITALKELNDFFISKSSTYKDMCPL